ncbi:TPA: hypothetical protein ACYTJQ_003205 [Yersinia enterocolitica]|nr:hypothetical protein [Yersinia enterocolitica]HDL6657636.1 hypothetical protein [Yersinia enterocolitica]HDL6683532.1 hypothetical protein [Yersinia enterocolitica]HDZ9833032.1 hypothetical protein [Yersinia enterocolitica]HEC1639760.1 hypothetical protein [Yersinia enterocolitica]
MSSIINLDQSVTMSSLEFLDTVINPARKEAGENTIRNNVFVARIEDELADQEITYKTFVRFGNEVKEYALTADQMLLVGMRESKAVRRKVLEYIRKKEAEARYLEDQKKRAAVQSANRRGVTWGDYCKTHGLPAQKLMTILKKERKLFMVNPISGEWSINPRFSEYFIVIKPSNYRFSPSGINIRFNAKGLEFFSHSESISKFRKKLVISGGTNVDKSCAAL